MIFSLARDSLTLVSIPSKQPSQVPPFLMYETIVMWWS